jgi:hypothetical protein
MMKYTFPIGPVDCYCSLLDFYKNAAIRCGLDITGKTKYDCTKICVSKEVHEQLLNFLIVEQNYELMPAVMLLGMAGPKANLEPSLSFPYYVEVEEGFVVREETEK